MEHWELVPLTIFLILMFGIHTLIVYLYYQYILLPIKQFNVWLWAFLLPTVFVVFLYSLIIINAFLVKLFRLDTYGEGEFSVTKVSLPLFKWVLFQLFWTPVEGILHAFQWEPLNTWAVKLFGAKVGKNSIVGGYITDPPLLEVGEKVIIGGKAVIMSHSGEKGKLVLKKVKIGNNVTVGEQAIVLPGSVLEDGCIVGAQALVPKNKKLEKGIWLGVPVGREK